MPVRNIHDHRGEPMDGVYIGRAGRQHDGYFGNPFPIGPNMSRKESLHRFTEWAKDRLYHDPEYRERARHLHGRNLYCFCHPLPCHGDVLLELARREHEHHDFSQRVPTFTTYHTIPF